MSAISDWMPTTRQQQLDMAKTWFEVFAKPVKPSTTLSETGDNIYTGSKAEGWRIPLLVITDLNKCIVRCSYTLAIINDRETRTEVAVAEANSAFATLTKYMRDIKRRYFFVPPLADTDIMSLGLRVRDGIHTPTTTPTSEVVIDPFLKGRHQLGINIVYVVGSPISPANKGYRVWYRVVAQGEKPPASPEDLHKSFYTGKRKDIINFDYTDSGKVVWLAVQIENDGKKGPWGPMIHAMIP
jgi:hypothetical protein